jgi:hypothetical protein
MSPTLERAGLFVVRGVLRIFELTMTIIAEAFDATSPKHRVYDGRRVRTAAGTVEPLAFDEYGRRVGAVSGSPAVGDV